VLLFLTPIRHPDNSSSPSQVAKLLELSLGSILNQTNGGFRIVIVCNRRPPIAIDDPRILFHVVDFRAPLKPNGARESIEVIMKDKGTKCMAGLLLARQFDPEYVFQFDADDFVSRQLVEFATARPGRPGWYVDRGYALNWQTRRIQRKFGMNRYCGTSTMVSAALLWKMSRAAPSLNENSSPEELLAGTAPGFVSHIMGDHRSIIRSCRSIGQPLTPLPFRGSVWALEHGENVGGVRRAPAGMPITNDLCLEFGMPADFAGVAKPNWLDGMRERAAAGVSWAGSRIASLRERSSPLEREMLSVDPNQSRPRFPSNGKEVPSIRT
jgi:hypothetical protein